MEILESVVTCIEKATEKLSAFNVSPENIKCKSVGQWKFLSLS